MSNALGIFHLPRYSLFTHFLGKGRGHPSDPANPTRFGFRRNLWLATAKEWTETPELMPRRAQAVRNPSLAEEFEKLAQSWLRRRGRSGTTRDAFQPTGADHPLRPLFRPQ